MKVYITRHGQIAGASYIGSEFFPKGEPPLSELGREQAKMLAGHLVELGFKGDIYASPYLRTMETAQLIAELTGSKIYPYAPIREIFKTEQSAQAFKGSTLDELKARFANVAEDAVLEYPWWKAHEEPYETVKARVFEGMDALTRNGEILLVGHGASSSALISYYKIKRKPMHELYNCSLSITDPEDAEFKQSFCDVSFMPFEKVTNNSKTRENTEREYFEKPYAKELAIPEKFRRSGRFLLHLGDTHSKDYPYYRALIELISPEIIVHTGDPAEEVKVGRIPGTEHEYLFKVGCLLDILAASGARRVILTAGNNDLPSDIARLAPFAELLPSQTLFEECGYKFFIGHDGSRYSSDADFILYGHSMRYEARSFSDNKPGEQCRFNALWGAFLLDLESGEFCLLEVPR